MDLSEQPGSGAAQRRRQRRLRSWLRHERMTVAMAPAERTHHSSRGQKVARTGVWGREMNYTATIRDHPPPQPELFSLYEEEPGGSRPDRLSEVTPQDRDLRRTGDQFVDAVPGLPALDVPVPQMVSAQDVDAYPLPSHCSLRAADSGTVGGSPECRVSH